MARPIKDNADYFSHDTSMRDDPRIKALRRKFGHEGYSIWNMLLESITDSDNFRFHIDYEITGGDYDIDPDKLKDIVLYCVKMDLLQSNITDTIIWSKTLDNRMAPLLQKRKRNRNTIDDELKAPETKLSPSENPQSKVKESKVNLYIEHGQPSDKYISVKAKYTTEKIQRVYSLREYFKNHDQLLGLETAGWIHFEAFMNDNPAKVFNDDDHLYNTFRNFCESYRAPPPKVGQYEGAEENHRLWTREAWEKQYHVQLQTDNNFRKHFGYDQLRSSSPMGNNVKS